MISVDEAIELVKELVAPLPTSELPLAEALGMRLHSSVESSVSSPPFDKSMLDGYAIDATDSSPTRKILETVIAGDVPRESVGPGSTVHLMTGAPLPAGANAVVKIEDTKLLDDQTVQLPTKLPEVGYGIFRKGSSFAQGEEVLPAGKLLRPIDLALAAEIGARKLTVTACPEVAVLATGNELVSSEKEVEPGQIRNSNSPMLLAAVTEMGADAIDLGIARDEMAELRKSVAQGLESNVLLITGGVSAGIVDLVPRVLAELGVRQVFHKVKMKPGKPLWFGVRETKGKRTLVFGLPGNPVSTLVSFVLFVRPALAALAGTEFARPQRWPATLANLTSHRGNRPTYHPCTVERDPDTGTTQVTPLRWRGSADLAALTRAEGLVLLPEGDYELVAGSRVSYLEL